MDIMRKLVLILIAFIAVITFITAFDNPGKLGTVEAIPASVTISE